MRLFFAVAVPGEITGLIAEEQKKIKDSSLRWVPQENQHFTLRFLGEVKEDRLNLLTASGTKVSLNCQPFSLQLSGTGFFPETGNPRIFWVGAQNGAERLTALANDLSEVLKGADFPSEDRLFLPHLTVARIKERLPEKTLERLTDWKEKDFGSFEVTEFLLMESVLLPAGAQYRKVQSFPLGKCSRRL